MDSDPDEAGLQPGTGEQTCHHRPTTLIYNLTFPQAPRGLISSPPTQFIFLFKL